jgi:hypothetical protein
MTTSEVLRQKVSVKLAEQRALVRALLRLREQLAGSLFSRYGSCGKETCACQSGALHGPYHVLSGAGAGRSGFSYLDERRLPQARELVARYKEFRLGMRRLKKVNTELVELLKRYQRSTTRRGVARLGLAS